MSSPGLQAAGGEKGLSERGKKIRGRRGEKKTEGTDVAQRKRPGME